MLRSILALAAALSLTACGGSEDVCSAATAHLEACTSLDWAQPGTCDAQNAELAEKVLAIDCDDLQQRQASFTGVGVFYDEERQWQWHDFAGRSDHPPDWFNVGHQMLFGGGWITW